ncbi:MAG: hypothetical protein J0H55_05190 [Chitinophagaceae bacterium]|nr:hypothetical protein [Chitinophagaceae bacterium]
MIRRYNYTGRKKLFTEKIKINEVAKNGRKQFQVSFDLKDSGFPDDACIYIEPYFKSSFLRFHFGTIARILLPDTTDVSDLPTTDQLLYRVKIVDEKFKHGLILATADIKGTLTDNPDAGKQSILPVDFVDLGNRVWALDFRINGPVLAVNSLLNKINIREKIKQEEFFSLVYPEVIKRIALKLAKTAGFFQDELSGWQSEWLTFFREVLMKADKPQNDDDLIEEWCNDMSDAFARKYQVFQLYTELNKIK